MDLAMLCNWYVMPGNHRFSWHILPTAWTPRLIPPHVPSFVSISQGLWRLNSLDWTVGADHWDLAMLCNWYVMAGNHRLLWPILPTTWTPRLVPPHVPSFVSILQDLWRLNSLDWTVGADRWDLAMLCNWYNMAGHYRL